MKTEIKGWVLMENNKIVCYSSIEVFKTKRELSDWYGNSLGELNSIKKVKIINI